MSNRHTAARVSVAALIAILGLSMSMMTFAQEASSSTSPSSESTASSSDSSVSGFGTITIQQKNVTSRKIMGEWTLLSAQSEGAQKGTLENVSLSNIAAGSYSLFITPPRGFSTSIFLYRGTTQIDYVKRPQLIFKLQDGDDLKIVINYNLTRTGVVSIQSNPSGLDFTLTGPNSLVEKGKTPMSFDDTPEGQYSVQFGTLEGCVVPPKKSQELVIDGRVSFSVTLACKSADILRDRTETKAENFVVISIDGADVQLRDVPQNSWFATFVFESARRGVLSGYRDAAGNPTGDFGPGNAVTVGELAKIAHRLGGISEGSVEGRNPENPRAAGQWFSPFITSAEGRGWTLYKDATVDPLRNVTRAEVMITLLQVVDIPLLWQKGTIFNDVTVRTRFANAIETAAQDGIIEGLTDAEGKPLHTFNPEGEINRAELAKILNKIFEVYIGKKSSSSARSSSR